ncbi:molecular chaperone TorD family protein [Halosimplex litoreum]|uniref:Molecular chaperone TorD family protein n=1 Tax=Halosimplex litoreum TaxID=1198301 RepID=A0A7T3FWP7_9EURY|nr:molecular chaperone TorD family protein [Halosimplex litoreum]QPV62116.1 molecular chaperone TorD family protein [Halosimplex litoreum]
MSDSVDADADTNPNTNAGRSHHAGDDRPAGPPPDGAAALARAQVYGLLAATFDGDVETLASALADGTVARLADDLPVEIPTAPLERSDPSVEALRVGYDNLFAVPGPHYVPPFASAWADDPSESFESDSPYHEAGEAGELFGDPAAAAARSHAAAGFEPERGDGVPDHLAASFEFMRALCEREAALLAGDTGDETGRGTGATDGEAGDGADGADELAAVRRLQRETVGRLGWLDAFHEAVERADSAERLFAALARLTRVFVAWDARAGVAAV